MFEGLKLAFIKYRSRHHQHSLMKAIHPFNDSSFQVVLSGLLILMFLEHFLWVIGYESCPPPAKKKGVEVLNASTC